MKTEYYEFASPVSVKKNKQERIKPKSGVVTGNFGQGKMYQFERESKIKLTKALKW